ncbi:hypothetical protein Tco_1187261, partial [Tanacetum coccineum]
MNPQETQQFFARDEKWVPFSERVKVSSTNVRLETIVPQKEDTFHVVIDLVKNSSCFKVFTISADVPEIFMQQFWIILDICPRVEGVNFTNVPDDDTTLAFLIKLGYKGPLYKHTNMFVDHMHQPWRTLAAIINKCLSGRQQAMTIYISLELTYYGAYSIERIIGKDYQEYGLSIPETMLTEAIKQSESYQMFIKYSTGQIRPKKSGGKESEPKPEPVKRKTSSKRRVKKKVTLSADDNIISDDPDTALELGKSISQTEAKEAEATRKVHATHARIVTEYVLEPTRRRKSGNVTFDPPKRLNGVPSLTPEEKEAADIMKALKESKKTSKRQLGTGGSNEGTGSILGVPDESTVISSTSSEGTGSKQESGHSEEGQLDDEEKDEKEGDADDE